MNPDKQNPQFHTQEGQSFLNNLHAQTSPISSSAAQNSAPSTPAKSMANREFAAQNLGNGLTDTNQNAAVTLAGHDTVGANIYFVSKPDESAMMSVMRPAEIAPSVNSAPNNPDATTTTAPEPDSDPQEKAAYLDQIAAAPAPARFFSGKTLIILGGAVAALVIVVIIGIATGGGKVKNAGDEILGQRLINLQKLVAYGEKNRVAGSDLNKIMAETDLVLLTSVNDLSKIYGTGGEGESSFKNPSPEVTAQYSTAQTITQLDQAKATANLDSTFAEALSNSLAETAQYVNSLRQNAKTQNLRAALDKTYKSLTDLHSRVPE